MTNEQELSKKLAEWRGLEVHLTDTPTSKPEMWEKHGSVLSNVGWIDFPNDLNACFERLWGKAIKLLAYTDLSTEREGCAKLLGLWLEEPGPPVTPLALCLTIGKLIDSEAKKGEVK